MPPGIRHGLLERQRILLVVALDRDPLDAAELCERVDSPGLERLDKTLYGVLELIQDGSVGQSCGQCSGGLGLGR